MVLSRPPLKDSLVDVSVSIAVAFLASIEKFNIRSTTFAFFFGGGFHLGK